MEFQNLIEKRRSVRKYVERNTVTKDEILSMIKAAQEAPSWKNSQTGRYYCIMDEKNVEQFRRECLPEMNAGKCENAVLLVSTFVYITEQVFRKMEQRIMKLEMDGDVMILGCRMRT